MFEPQDAVSSIHSMSIFGREPDLTALVRRCQNNDADAWKMVVDQYSGLVYSVAKRYKLNNDDASDVFQATFQALHSGIDRIDRPESLGNWLAVTAARMSLRILRNTEHVPLTTADRDLTEVLASEEMSAEDEAVQACESSIIRLAVKKMGGRCAPLLSMLYLQEGGSYQEASKVLGLPIGTIGPTRTRCLEKLRKILEAAGFFE